MKIFWIIVTTAGAIYFTVLGIFIAALLRAMVRTRQIRDVIAPEDLLSNETVVFRPPASVPPMSSRDLETLGEINHECIP